MHSSLQFIGYKDNGKVVRKINRIEIVEQGVPVALIFLDEPLWELGWCGITFINYSEEIKDLPLFSIHHLLKKDMKG